ncbi:MAG: epoxyqueuosine reductase QueH [Candidatus Omnitrophica bacterium]|nr:epoxyqueuosine reductase QueH [Candidatus Omnitrophota bacterium]
MERLFLHICCAPCLIYPLESLTQKKFTLVGFFYNPNIHPLGEFNNRKMALEDFAQQMNLKVIYPSYRPGEFFQRVGLKRSSSKRCLICWDLRLKRTALEAKANNFDYFSTTLLVSPYQDHDLLKKIGYDIAKEVGIKFYYEDFRTGFRDAQRKAKQKGIYCQRYCGCIYSKKEQCRVSEKH